MDRPTSLLYVSDEQPGIKRKRWGKGFIYLNNRNRKITSERTIDRIKNLVIPPIWKDVWICSYANGYLQAIGYDARNRKQYLYHPDWTAYRQKKKFDKMIDFGQHLPSIRKAYQKDLRKRKWTKDKVLALIIYLLDNYYFRVGNDHYTKTNNSFGITTLRKKHIQQESYSLSLSYKAKSNKIRNIKIDDKKITKLIKDISELPGYEIFRYLDENGKSCKVDSADVNDYLQSIAGNRFTAKNFRTWGASKMLFEHYTGTKEEVEKNPRLKFETNLVKNIAEKMGNTVSICRNYYLHPYILEVLNDHYPKPLASLKSGLQIKNDLFNEFEILLLENLKKQKLDIMIRNMSKAG